jgi:hypothetical protein
MIKNPCSLLLAVAVFCPVLLRTAAAQDAPSAVPVTQSSQSSAQAEAGEPRADTSAAAPKRSEETSKPAPAHPQRGAPAAKAPQPAQKPGNDRLDLGTATVTGDREQPKVMYIVPWKKSDIGDLSGKPMNSLLDEALAPVDRDEFKREVVYYQAVNGNQNGASKAPSKQGEK